MNEESLIEALIRGFSKPIILWLIFLKPMHGYHLMREFKNITGKKLKPAVVYPFLHSLEAGGYVVGTWIKNGRRRVKQYKLTTKGESLLSSLKKRLSTSIKAVLLDLVRRKGK
jgi:PadR family transcriptional regulator PadR